jgi:fatty-acyl-CoA synthase
MDFIELTLSELLQQETDRSPNKEFVIYPDRKIRYTYGEFNNRVNTLAKGLLEIGIAKGDHVGIWASNVTDWITLMFSTAKIGAVLVTINTNYKLSELEYLVKQADLKALCIIEGFKDSDYIE